MLTQIGEFPNLSWHHRFFISLPTDLCQKWTSELKWFSCSNPSTKMAWNKVPKVPDHGDWQSWLSLHFGFWWLAVMTFPAFSGWKPCFSADHKQFLADRWSVVISSPAIYGPFQKRSTLPSRRKFLPFGGEKNLFLIIVSVLGHPKGVRSAIIDVVGMFMVKHRKKCYENLEKVLRKPL